VVKRLKLKNQLVKRKHHAGVRHDRPPEIEIHVA
jgi:hypothetical protein